MSNGDTLMWQIWYDYVKGQKRCGPNTKPCQNPNKFEIGVKGQRYSGSWLYAYPLMVIHPCAKYGRQMSKQNKLWAGHDRRRDRVILNEYKNTVKGLLSYHCKVDNSLYLQHRFSNLYFGLFSWHWGLDRLFHLLVKQHVAVPVTYSLIWQRRSYRNNNQKHIS